MTQIILQPCGDGLPTQHYVDTVEKEVPLDRIGKYVAESSLADLKILFPRGQAAAWGVTAGKQSGGANKWKRMEVGDIALFSRKGKIFSSGTVIYKLHNERLARSLWGEDEEGQTWEYMYFLKDIHSQDITYEQFNLAAGYSPKNVIQGFNVLPEQTTLKVLQLVDLASAAPGAEKELEEIRAITNTDEFDPDSEGEGRKKAFVSICRRQGQPEFRRKLIAAYGGRCAITGCDAIQTLEAAHISPYDGPKTNHPANGILLRSDFHVLFDLGLLLIDPDTLTVRLSQALKNTVYAEYDGRKISMPIEKKLSPNPLALKKRLQDCTFRFPSN